MQTLGIKWIDYGIKDWGIWFDSQKGQTIFFSPVALCGPNAGHGLFFSEVSRSHTTNYHSRWDSFGRVISWSQRPLPDNTQHSHETNLHAPRHNSNPQSHQTSGRRPSSQTARTLGLADRISADISRVQRGTESRQFSYQLLTDGGCMGT